jgi:hypothetical protein
MFYYIDTNTVIIAAIAGLVIAGLAKLLTLRK